MKKVIFVAVTAFAFTCFSSFKAVPPSTIIDQHFDFCGPYDILNTCNGEIVTIDGCYSVDVHVVITGTKVNFSAHTQGTFTGTGSLGNVYNASLNENQHENLSLVNTQASQSYIGNLRLTSKGSSVNYREMVTFHVTVNANGTVIILRTDDVITCNG